MVLNFACFLGYACFVVFDCVDCYLCVVVRRVCWIIWSLVVCECFALVDLC